MFDKKQLEVLEMCVNSHISVVLRRFRAESHDGIKSILSEQLDYLDNLKTYLNNPKLLTKDAK